MRKAVFENWALFVGIAMLMVANGLMGTLLTVRGAELGFSATTIGAMQSGYPLGALLGTLLAPRMILKVGHIRAFSALASLCSVSAIIHLMTTDAMTWTAMRLLAGFCFPGLYVITESWLNAKSENRMRAQILSFYFITQTLGSAAGVSLAGLKDPTGTVLFGLVSILLSLSIVPLLLSSGKAPEYAVPERMPMRRLFAISPMAVAGAALNGAIAGAIFVALPLYALENGLSRVQASGALAFATLAGAIALYPVGWLSDRVDRRIVVILLSVGGLALTLPAVVAPGTIGLVWQFALISAVATPVYSVCLAHANDHLNAAQIVPASGAMVFALNAGILFGAFAGPASTGFAGGTGYPVLLAGLFLASALIAGLRRVTTDAPEEIGQTQAVSGFAVPQTGYLQAEVLVAEEESPPE